jgi:hypothetical protein
MRLFPQCLCGLDKTIAAMIKLEPKIRMRATRRNLQVQPKILQKGTLNNFEAFDIFRKGFNKNYEALCKHFRRNGSFNKKSEAYSNIMRIFEDIFNGIDAFLK